MAKRKEPFTSALEDGRTGDAADQVISKLQPRPAPPTEPTPAPGGNTPNAQLPPGQMAPQVAPEIDIQRTPASPTVLTTPDWLTLARDSWTASTTYLDSSLRGQWERNERAWQSQHPNSSKYYSDAYKSRSKLFRPKTRSSSRMAEAAVAASFFGNEDVVAITAIDDENPVDQAGADIIKELLQYRLTNNNPKRSVPWFRTVVGGYQDAEKYGVVTSKQWWEYEDVNESFDALDKQTNQPVIDPSTGQPVKVQRNTVRIDRPRVVIYPPEQVRIDRGADWVDPIGTSPYTILMNPMYIADLEAIMARPAGDGTPMWIPNIGRSELLKAKGRTAWDSTRLAREPGREDSKESEIAVPEFQIVWAHENFVRWGGDTLVYWTAGIETLLSEPMLVQELYPHLEHGELPVVMGNCLIEAHKNYPSGKPQLTQELQSEANEIVNLRLDNVKLALNKRYLVKRGRQVDLRSLTRSSPGAVTIVTDVDADVKEMEFRDVTASSFAEQDRVNVDFDDIAGNFSPGTVQTNRRLNETVGGMQLMAGSANQIGELDMRVFAETWAEPVLRQLVRMEQWYETDVTVIGIAGKKAKIWKRHGVDTITDDMMMRDMMVKANIGIGATDPMRKLQKLQTGAEILEKIFGPALMPLLKSRAVIAEVMAALGYRDGGRFFNDQPDPMVAMLQQQLQELQTQIDRQEISAKAKVQVSEITGLASIINALIKQGGATADRQQQAALAGQDQQLQIGQQQADQQHQTKLATMNNNATAEGRLQQNIALMRKAILETAAQGGQLEDATANSRNAQPGGAGPANQPAPQPPAAPGMAPPNGAVQ